MADKKISDFTAASSIAAADLFEIEQGGNSRKATGTLVRKLAYGEWTDLSFPGSTSTNLGLTSYLANETFSLANGDRIEVEFEIEKAANANAAVGVIVGSNGYYMRFQGDDNNGFYRYNGGSATNLTATGANALYDYGGFIVGRFVLNVTGASENRFFVVFNDERHPSTTQTQNTTFTMAGTASILLEGTIKRARARALT